MSKVLFTVALVLTVAAGTVGLPSRQQAAGGKELPKYVHPKGYV